MLIYQHLAHNISTVQRRVTTCVYRSLCWMQKLPNQTEPNWPKPNWTKPNQTKQTELWLGLLMGPTVSIWLSVVWKIYPTKAYWTKPNTPNQTPTYGTISAWRFNGSNSQHRSLCMKQNPRQEQSDRSSSAWRWQLFMDHVMGKSQWRVASEKHH